MSPRLRKTLLAMNGFVLLFSLQVSGQPPETRDACRRDQLPPGGMTRQQCLEELQRRQAMNRSQIVQAPAARVLQDDRTARGRRVQIADGFVEYGGVQEWRRAGIVSTITAGMLAADQGTAAGVDISGLGPGIARGHLLARSLGGDGRDVRNLVPLAHEFTNLQQYQLIEQNVRHHVLRHGTPQQHGLLGRIDLRQALQVVSDPHYGHLHTAGYYHTVRYAVTPRYAGRELIYPVALEFVAQCLTCGQWIQPATIVNTILRSRL